MGDNTQDELIYRFILNFNMSRAERNGPKWQGRLEEKNLPRVNSLVLALCVTRFPPFMSPQITFYKQAEI